VPDQKFNTYVWALQDLENFAAEKRRKEMGNIFQFFNLKMVFNNLRLWLRTCYKSVGRLLI
jgi:ABC-type methionine transport system ATPase subunit